MIHERLSKEMDVSMPWVIDALSSLETGEC